MTARAAYPHFQTITTRWKDNDVYGHVNNVEYYSFFDTVINTYLIRAGLDIHAGATIGLCVESHCRFDGPLQFPDAVDAGLRVAHLGRSSVRYEIALFRSGEEKPAAEGWFVHVFVGRDERRPQPIPEPLRKAMQAIQIETGAPS